MSSGTPAVADPEADGLGREVHDPAQAATALLEGEPLVILRSESADVQAGKVNALQAALQRRSIRVLRLDGTHPRGLSPLAVAERDADRAVLVVEHPDRLEPATLEALRDVENLQLVLAHREDARIDLSAMEPASVRFPPGLVAFDLDPERRRWRPIVGATLLTLIVGGLLTATMLYVDPPWRSPDGEHTITAKDIAPPTEPATPPTGPATSSGGDESAVNLKQSAPGTEIGPGPQPPATTTEASAPSPPASQPGDGESAVPSTAPVNIIEQSSPNAAIASVDRVGPSEPTEAPASTEPAATAEAPATPSEAAPAQSADAGTASSAETARPTPATAPSRPTPFHSKQRAQLKHDFDRFLASDHHLPKHITRAQRNALFEKFLAWRSHQELSAAR